MFNTRHSSRRVAMAFVALTLAPLSTAPVSQPAISDADVEKAVAEIRTAHAEAQARLRKLPRDRMDRMWVVEQADSRPDRLADWVRDHTRWVPYRGVLRDADGVLLDRMGNSLDRSLLLRALLEDAGHDARLVRGQLPATAVAQVLQQAGTGPYEPLRADTYENQQARAVVDRASEQAAELIKLVELSDRDWTHGVEHAVADHWWVEVKIGSAWRTLDPLLVGPLEKLRPQPTARFGRAKLPAGLFQTVTTRVVVERWDQGSVSEEIPLQHTIRTAEARYSDLELQFVPFGFEPVPPASGAGAEALAIADTTEEWLPVIRAGTRLVRNQGFDRTGRLERNPARLAVHRKAESATRALGGLGQTAPAPARVLSGCWIEYEITQPGRAPQVVRREVFDLVGPDRRQGGDLKGLTFDADAVRTRGMAMAGVTRILITGGSLPPVAIEKASLDLWAHHGPQLAAFVRLLANPDAEEPLQRFYREPIIALDLIAFAVTRSEVSRHRSVIYQGSPNIFTTHFVPDSGGGLVVSRSVDLVANDVGVAASASVPAARIRLEQGVLDTVLEHALFPVEGTAINTADLFARRGVATGAWSLSNSWPESSPLPASVRARMAAAVGAGRAVVAPEWVGSGHEPAWWEIDKATGTTLGIGPKGWGQITEDPATRSIGAGGVREGTRRVGIQVSCKVLIAVLLQMGMPIRMLPGPQGPVPILTPHLMNVLRSFGCK